MDFYKKMVEHLSVHDPSIISRLSVNRSSTHINWLISKLLSIISLGIIPPLNCCHDCCVSYNLLLFQDIMLYQGQVKELKFDSH